MLFLVSTCSLILVALAGGLAFVFIPKFFERLPREFTELLQSEDYTFQGGMLLSGIAVLNTIMILLLSEPNFFAAVLMMVAAAGLFSLTLYLVPQQLGHHRRLANGQYVSDQQMHQTQLLCAIVAGSAALLSLTVLLMV